MSEARKREIERPSERLDTESVKSFDKRARAHTTPGLSAESRRQHLPIIDRLVLMSAYLIDACEALLPLAKSIELAALADMFDAVKANFAGLLESERKRERNSNNNNSNLVTVFVGSIRSAALKISRRSIIYSLPENLFAFKFRREASSTR